MFISTIIPTIGRPQLDRAVQSVLDQEFAHDNFEVIVVNDSGKPLPDAEWQRSGRVTVIHTDRRNRSVARNAGASIAKGQYLHFLDDDDWMLPGAFAAFRELSTRTSACWLYGAFRFVNNTGEVISDIRPNEANNCFIQLVAWEWLPLQASIIDSTAFANVGGFASLESLAGGFEDIDLSRQVALHYDIGRTDQVVACIRIGDQGSTTNYVDMFVQNRLSREKALTAPGALARMIDSARSSPSRPGYWHGKAAYYYLASVKWQLKNQHMQTAFVRGASVLAASVAAGRHLLTTDFWKGVSEPHYPRMAIALQDSGADHLYADTRSKLSSMGEL